MVMKVVNNSLKFSRQIRKNGASFLLGGCRLSGIAIINACKCKVLQCFFISLNCVGQRDFLRQIFERPNSEIFAGLMRERESAMLTAAFDWRIINMRWSNSKTNVRGLYQSNMSKPICCSLEKRRPSNTVLSNNITHHTHRQMASKQDEVPQM
ncbi:hypothetical protein KAFR_0B05050 [Kazachstania africana CBS 2517]|uniref:Uncharacterized protein n=1 Tax=Kazachstania africana (strain ATCC 22294 / BCRC 22015 / CBS 2517 / CECT 1963 / NBRC 1671 / NRRL Y-8276) TaxID=1071382 RepID=H2AR01_KAZAF|nr:hypothetical protein KAFR_0B05050 [Kazachstania africana CBS 2517]CCF56801.1 hypothetical protein KAFR_0B05050 [Kazachstania africana CBS 2517]